MLGESEVFYHICCYYIKFFDNVLLCILQTNILAIAKCCKVFHSIVDSFFSDFGAEKSEWEKTLGPLSKEVERSARMLSKTTAGFMSAWEINRVNEISKLS